MTKKAPPLDHRVLDQRWISGRFLVDCSDSNLFLHACHEKFFDVNCKLQLYFKSRNSHLNVLCPPRYLIHYLGAHLSIINHGLGTCHRHTELMFFVSICSIKNLRKYVSKHLLTYGQSSHMCTGVSSLGVPGVPWHPQILTDQLTLSQPGGQIIPT